MNVPERPKFRMRGERYFRRGSNNSVRFYINVVGWCAVFGVCHMLKSAYVRPLQHVRLT